MDAFLKGKDTGGCFKLFKEKGNVFDIQRAREKRWKQSGCKNRFSFFHGIDIGDLSEDSFFKTEEGACFINSDLDGLEQKVGLSVFGSKPISQKDIELVWRLPKEKSLGRELAEIGVKPVSKIQDIRDFLNSVGKGLPVPWEIAEYGEDRSPIRHTVSSIAIFLALEQEGLIWIPRSRTLKYYGEEKALQNIGRGSILLDNREFCFSESFRTEMKKIRKLPAKFRHVIVNVSVAKGGHANILILDRKKKTASFFEPHGLVSRDEFFQGTEDFLKKFLETFELRGYKADYGEASCPWFGPQTLEPQQEYKTGYCQTWTELFAYCKVKFPELSDAEINYALTHGLKPNQIRDRVERFAAFAWYEGKKAAKKLRNFSDEPEKAFHFGGDGKFPTHGKSLAEICVKY